MLDSFAKIVNSFQPSIFVNKSSILDVWQGSEYSSGTNYSNLREITSNTGPYSVYQSILCGRVLWNPIHKNIHQN